MSRISVAGLFIATIIAGTIVMPAMFGIDDNFLALIFLVALIVVYGTKDWIVWSGVIMAAAVELLQGIYPGSLVMSWLLTAWVWHLMTQFFSLRPLLESSRRGIIAHVAAGLLLLGIMSFAMIGIEYGFYGHSVTPAVLQRVVHMPMIILWVVVTTTVYLMLLGGLGRKGTSYYG